MPKRLSSANDFQCRDCGHKFKQSLWRRLLSHASPSPVKRPRSCPNCGSRNVGILFY